MGEYQGGTASISWWSLNSSKKSILSAPLCLDRYFVCANVLQLDSTCAIDSCAFPHILHLTSDSSLDLVFLALYSFVGSSCSWNSLIPAIVCVGAVFQSDIQGLLSPHSNFVALYLLILCCSARWIWISQL